MNGDIEDETLGPDPSFYDKYIHKFFDAWEDSFLNALGSFSSDRLYYRDVDWIVFTLSCFFNMIIMLNLLIAIISEAYAKIAANQVNNAYKEKAR